MEAMEGAGDGKISAPLGKEQRANLIAWATSILMEEADDEILESIFELLRGLRTNTDMREELKKFRKHGWALIWKTQDLRK